MIASTRTTLDWLQSLRGIAAILVVMTHARYFFLNTPAWPAAEQYLLPGAMGVDLFFIISGFIMAYTTRGSDGSWRYVLDFAAKRLARIWPVYVVITCIWLLVAHSGIGYFREPTLLVVLAKSLLFLPVNPDAPLFFGLSLPVAWTLEFEIYFYAIFGVSLLFRRLRWFVLASWMLLTVILLPLRAGVLTFDVMSNLHYSVAYLSLASNPIVLEFLFGAVIAAIYVNEKVRIPSRTVAMHFLLLTVAPALWLVYSGFVHFHGPKTWGAAMALAVLGIAVASKTVALRPPRLLVWLGQISFSLYLTHTITQLWMTRWIEGMGGDTHSLAHVFVTTAVALSFAALSYHYLEDGLAVWVRKHLLKLLHGSAAAPVAVAPLREQKLAA